MKTSTKQHSQMPATPESTLEKMNSLHSAHSAHQERRTQELNRETTNVATRGRTSHMLLVASASQLSVVAAEAINLEVSVAGEADHNAVEVGVDTRVWTIMWGKAMVVVACSISDSVAYCVSLACIALDVAQSAF